MSKGKLFLDNPLIAVFAINPVRDNLLCYNITKIIRKAFSMLNKIFTSLLLLFSTSIFAQPIPIVAAENFYGDIVQKIGGPFVSVTSILQNPNQDPHLFSSNPSTAKMIAAADVVIYNGIDYDPWMINLLAPNALKTRQIIIVASLVKKQQGDNPHIWYDPRTILTYADYLTRQLTQLDPTHQTYFEQQLANFKQHDDELTKKIIHLRQLYQGTPVIATEPVFNEMANRLGLKMYGLGFQLSVMNDTEPSATDTKNFEDLLNQHQVKVLIYNNQVSNPLTENMRALAEKAGIPQVGVTETQPEQQDYFSWMTTQLDALAAALNLSNQNH